MVKAVGFRNLIAPEYGKIELRQVFEIAQENVEDLDAYLKAVFKKLGLVE
ncbi:MAG: DUF86 domain-containing protein [Candidatus Tectomicrobia bacterium]|uniref:DUF86 domain-containing protein n=1 Tax=Tectimicrobiota bacterium TaxID=2528274 RepID=A0A933GM14_UNCTE|nr:DUF86 domain-containing protein [Candidatus Tectomicrobia bacterium]